MRTVHAITIVAIAVCSTARALRKHRDFMVRLTHGTSCLSRATDHSVVVHPATHGA
jgi:hypothetical protein